MILGLVGHVGPSALHRPYHWEQAFLHFSHAGKHALPMFSGESEVWIFMCNLLILMLATNFFPEKTVQMKSPQ